VHAPTAGDVVRVAPVWWAEFFGAARVVGAVAGPGGAVAVPVFRAASQTSRRPAPPSTRPDSTPVRTPAGDDTRAGTSRPTGPGRPTCDTRDPATDRRRARSAEPVTAPVTGLVASLVRRLTSEPKPKPKRATAPSPDCSVPAAVAGPAHRPAR
jgi:hypothetical protein